MKHLATALSLLGMVTLPLLLQGTAGAASQCRENGRCELEGRTYQVKTPVNWDGESLLPVLIHFHGWGRTGRNVLNNPRVTSATENNGFLLVAPDGLGKSWDFWGNSSRDTPFVLSVMKDLPQKWPIDSSQIYVSGFSYGGAMAWRLACESGEQLAGILPIAGTLWQQDSINCKGGPVNVTQVHGLKDNVMRLPRGDGNNPLKGIELWRRTNNCKAEPDLVEKLNIFTCHRWTSCNSGKNTSICLHNYGHMIPKGWLDLVLAEAVKN
ncbi:alpha/beta hydrolase family esterase [Kiloniella sp.]|uniref:alpha/beta hydrolase family esterase n=1 Tax=Kiloniella sp. TaxID=1938587 RepID=UPI003B013071